MTVAMLVRWKPSRSKQRRAARSTSSRRPPRGLRAAAAADELAARLAESGAENPGSVSGAANAKAAAVANLVLLAVPFDGHDDLVAELAPQLAGKTVIDLTNKAEDPLSLASGFEPVRHRLGIDRCRRRCLRVCRGGADRTSDHAAGR